MYNTLKKGDDRGTTKKARILPSFKNGADARALALCRSRAYIYIYVCVGNPVLFKTRDSPRGFILDRSTERERESLSVDTLYTNTSHVKRNPFWRVYIISFVLVDISSLFYCASLFFVIAQCSLQSMKKKNFRPRRQAFVRKIRVSQEIFENEVGLFVVVVVARRVRVCWYS